MNKVSSKKIVDLLKRAYPDAKCSLDFKTPLQLAIATILSAQSTDERVNLTTPALFKKYKSVGDFARAKQSELEAAIKPVGLYRNKAKNIIAFAKVIEKDHKGKIPTALDELQTLPGVGRKTANVIQGVLIGRGDGIAVDTHVARLSYRLGLTRSEDPKKIEQDLMKWIGQSDRVLISHMLIQHGRIVCFARKPLCDQCFMADVCPKRGVNQKR